MTKCFQIIIVTLLLCVNNYSIAQKMHNSIFAENIRTLLVISDNDTLGLPIIYKDADNRVTVSFDEMSHNLHYYSYRIKHCESDWTLSKNISEVDFIKGFNDNKIEESYQSINTTFNYTNYSFTIPNEDLEITASGNYVIEIFDTDKPDSIIATATFSVCENLIGITGDVTYNTEYGVNNKYQQLNFNLDCSDANVSSPKEQLKVVVCQNGRTDNAVCNVLPTYVEGSNYIYKQNKELIFEGGNEYKRVDFSHIRNYSGEIDQIYFERPYYHVNLKAGIDESNKPYKYDFDVDGRYKIHGQNITDEKEIDYSIVHFTFNCNEPWIDGNLYINGYLFNNELGKSNKMTYNYDTKKYELITILKNGGYNYNYLFVPSGLHKGSEIRTSGSHWETENEYLIYVYYRPIGGLYDRLAAVEIIKSTETK